MAFLVVGNSAPSTEGGDEFTKQVQEYVFERLSVVEVDRYPH